MDITIGDVVELKSGSMPMTVVEWVSINQTVARVIWRDPLTNKLETMNIGIGALRKCEPKP